MVYRDFNIASNGVGGNFNVFLLQDGAPVRLFLIRGFYDVARGDTEAKYFEGKKLEDALKMARELGKLTRLTDISELKKIN